MKTLNLTNSIMGFLFLTLINSFAYGGIIKFFNLNQQGQLIANEASFNDDISEITAAIDSYKISNVNVNVVIKPEDNNASFDTGTIVEIPRTMVLRNHMGANPSYKTTINALAVYAHEYGHSVFDEHISAAIPDYEKMKRIKTEISMQSLKLLSENLNQQQFAETKKRVQDLTNLLIADKEILRLSRLTLPYHEVFADTIAVFVMNNKSAIYDALYYDYSDPYDKGWGGSPVGIPNGYNDPHDPNRLIAGRDFSVTHDVNQWSNNSEHGLFSPLRSVIGSDECWPRTENEKSEKLKALLQILLSDLIEKNKTKSFPEIVDNKKLIQAYKSVCKQ